MNLGLDELELDFSSSCYVATPISALTFAIQIHGFGLHD
jgi:hypothetical protein